MITKKSSVCWKDILLQASKLHVVLLFCGRRSCVPSVPERMLLGE